MKDLAYLELVEINGGGEYVHQHTPEQEKALEQANSFGYELGHSLAAALSIVGTVFFVRGFFL